MTSARSSLKTRISKHNKIAAELLGAPPAGFEDDEDATFTAGVRLVDLTKANEWDTPTRKNARVKKTRASEYLAVDLPSSRDMPLYTADLARAGAYEIVLRLAWLADVLHEICLSLVVQVEIFRRTIKRTPGAGPMTQRDKTKAATNMREQYQSVRTYAQQYNVFRDRMRRISAAHAFKDSHPEYSVRAAVDRNEFKALTSLDIRCDTKAYDTLGNGIFSLPWFWKMTSRTKDISDETFIQDCKPLCYSPVISDSTMYSLPSPMDQRSSGSP